MSAGRVGGLENAWRHVEVAFEGPQLATEEITVDVDVEAAQERLAALWERSPAVNVGGMWPALAWRPAQAHRFLARHTVRQKDEAGTSAPDGLALLNPLAQWVDLRTFREAQVSGV